MKNTTAIFSFILLVILTNVSVLQAQFICQPGQAPTVIEGSINNGDLSQLGRLTRDGTPSNCGVIGSGGLENNALVKRDSHNFANPFNQTVCVKVEMDFSGCGNQVQSVAYSNYVPTTPAANVIGDSGYSTINKGSYLFSVGPNANFTIVVNEVDQNSGCPLYKLKVTYLTNCRQPGFDKTNDGKADLAIYRTSTVSQWWTLDSETNQASLTNFGTVGDIVTGGSDYTGDGRTDLSVYRNSTNTWYFGTDQNNPGANFSATQWGTNGDRPAPGDYDGDGKSDVAVWRNADGNFYVLRSSDQTLLAYHWGATNDRLAVGDFDGDTVSDFVVVRPTASGLVWYIQKSNYNYGFDQFISWGLSAGDKIVPADYDGDSITDVAVWRESEGNFYVRRSSDLTMQVFRWGTTGDIPQPADYDGDKQVDFAVYRPSNGTWYIHNSATQTARVVPFGTTGDIAMAANYRIQ